MYSDPYDRAADKRLSNNTSDRRVYFSVIIIRVRHLQLRRVLHDSSLIVNCSNKTTKTAFTTSHHQHPGLPE